MRAIFLNRYFYPDHSATSQMLSDLAFFCPGYSELLPGFQESADVHRV